MNEKDWFYQNSSVVDTIYGQLHRCQQTGSVFLSQSRPQCGCGQLLGTGDWAYTGRHQQQGQCLREGITGLLWSYCPLFWVPLARSGVLRALAGRWQLVWVWAILASSSFVGINVYFWCKQLQQPDHERWHGKRMERPPGKVKENREGIQGKSLKVTRHGGRRASILVSCL